MPDNENKKVADPKVEPVSKGLVYRNKETGEEVAPFLVEPNGNVRFAPVGRSVERNMSTTEFSAAFELKPIESKSEPERRRTEPGFAEPTLDSKPIRTDEQRQSLEDQKASPKVGEKK